MMKSIFLVVLLIGLTACKKDPPHPTPEDFDPVSADLQKRLGKKKKFEKASTETLEITKTDMMEAEPQTGKYQRKRLQYFKELRALRKLRQEIKYLELRIMSRRIYVRKAYKKAYDADKPWPDPYLKTKYEVNRKLAEAQPNWDMNVPTIDKRYEEYKAKKDAELEEALGE